MLDGWGENIDPRLPLEHKENSCRSAHTWVVADGNVKHISQVFYLFPSQLSLKIQNKHSLNMFGHILWWFKNSKWSIIEGITGKCMVKV